MRGVPRAQAGRSSISSWQRRSRWAVQVWVGGGLIAAVGGPAVTDDDAVEVGIDEVAGRFEASTVGHVVGGGLLVGGDPQPGGAAIDPPAGLVHHHHLGVVEAPDDLGVDGTRSVPVDWAAWHRAPAVTSTPRRASNRAHLANDNPSP